MNLKTRSHGAMTGTAAKATTRWRNVTNRVKARYFTAPLSLKSRAGYFAASAAAIVTIGVGLLAIPWEVPQWLYLTCILGFVLLLVVVTELSHRNQSNRYYTVPDEAVRHASSMRVIEAARRSTRHDVISFNAAGPTSGTGETEYFTTDPEVNLALATHANEIAVRLFKPEFALPEELAPWVPSLTNELIASARDATLFNGRNVRLMTSLRGTTREVSVQPVRYFDYRFSNCQVYHRFRSSRPTEDVFDPLTLMLSRPTTGNDEQLREHEDGTLADPIGASTLVITQDHYLIIARQGIRSATNPGRFAPSGSGSVDLTDFEALTLDQSTLEGLIKNAAEREFLEEIGLTPKHNQPLWTDLMGRMETRVFGYARILAYGGKPDFFALTKLRRAADRVLEHGAKNREEIAGLMLSSGRVKLPTDGLDGVIEALASYREDLDQEGDKGRLESIQLGIMRHILSALSREGSHDLDAWLKTNST